MFLKVQLSEYIDKFSSAGRRKTDIHKMLHENLKKPLNIRFIKLPLKGTRNARFIIKKILFSLHNVYLKD